MTCQLCDDTRIQIGGWMGPTPQAPYPRGCPACSPDLSGRELQTAYAAWLSNAPEATRKRGLEMLSAKGAYLYKLVIRDQGISVTPNGHMSRRGGGRGLTTAQIREADIIIGSGNRIVKHRDLADGTTITEAEVQHALANAERGIDR